MKIQEAQIGIAGPSFYIVVSDSQQIGEETFLDGLLIYPSGEPLHLIFAARNEDTDVVNQLDGLALEEFQIRASAWISENKGNLGAYLSASLRFSDIGDLRLLILRHRGAFDLLRKANIRKYSTNLSELVSNLLAKTKFNITQT
ncbi:hypothetical protein [Limnobacter litoralis]|uniref:Uncharacterized protein n=1 Tax=Limnobacter litoralis TaxID=481366 RepID=A0ABQ5YUG2_9BURK|nr:hypothetical protein [Limnobacter litoralis]GLR26533.1 hypothetical protein GCM10007875_16230 [Limnobacter litoralis]